MVKCKYFTHHHNYIVKPCQPTPFNHMITVMSNATASNLMFQR